MAILALNLATLALASATDEARLPRELAPLESFESLEALKALDAFHGSDAPAKLIESSGFTTESS